MEKRNTNVLKPYVLILYVIIFYSIWAIWEFSGKFFINSISENKCLLQLIKSGIIKNLIWTLPAVLLVNYFNTNMYVSLKDMFAVKALFRNGFVKAALLKIFKR